MSETQVVIRPEYQEFINARIAAATKDYNDTLDKLTNKHPLVYAAYDALVAEGIKLPALYSMYSIGNLDVDITNPEDWGKIHKVLGKLYCSSKNPVEKKHKTIEVVMRPENEVYTWSFSFKFERKLTPEDKCQIVKRTKVERSVQCKVG